MLLFIIIIIINYYSSDQLGHCCWMAFKPSTRICQCGRAGMNSSSCPGSLTVFRVLFWIHDSFLYIQKMIEVQTSYGLVLSLVILVSLGLSVFLVSCLILLGSFCVSPLFFSSQRLLWKSVSSPCLFTHLFHVSVSVSLPQLSHVSVCVLSTCLCFLSCLVSSFVSPVCHVSVYSWSQCLVHVLVWVSVCVTSHLICPYVLICTCLSLCSVLVPSP